MKTLHISVVDKVATYQKRDGVIVCGNSDYQIFFTFDDDWGNYDTKTARFIYGGTYTDVVFSGNTCPVPVLRNITSVSVGLYAGDLCTSTPAEIECQKSILCNDGIPEAPTENVYGQIVELINSKPMLLPTVNISENDPTTWEGPPARRSPMYGCFINKTTSKHELWFCDEVNQVWVFNRYLIPGDMLLCVNDIPDYNGTAKGTIWMFCEAYSSKQLIGHTLRRIIGEKLATGYTVTISGGYEASEETSVIAYSLDGGNTWNEVTSDSHVINNVTQIMFKDLNRTAGIYDKYYYPESDEDEYSWAFNTNYTISENTQFTLDYDW